MAKKDERKFYDIVPLLETESLYNLIIGRRSNGKSYAVKYLMLWEAYNGCDYLEWIRTKEMVPKDRYQMAYIRRYNTDIKTKSVEAYFSDMPISEITHGEYNTVVFYRKEIFFANVDDDLKVERGKKIGNAFDLAGCQHYKSLSYPFIGNLVYEEFLPEDGHYLPNEVGDLVSIMSTILRLDFGRIFMVANTVYPDSPFFNEWQLTNIDRQKPGTIDIYNQETGVLDEDGDEITVKVAVEFVGDDVAPKTNMFFGNSARITMASEWSCNQYPHLIGKLNDYRCVYKVLYKYNRFSFMINLLVDPETKQPFVYVYPSTKENGIKRIVTTEWSTNPLITDSLTPVTKYDNILLELIDKQRVVFSSNLDGTKFYSIIKERGKL